MNYQQFDRYARFASSEAPSVVAYYRRSRALAYSVPTPTRSGWGGGRLWWHRHLLIWEEGRLRRAFARAPAASGGCAIGTGQAYYPEEGTRALLWEEAVGTCFFDELNLGLLAG